jgi:hypothetical protein
MSRMSRSRYDLDQTVYRFEDSGRDLNFSALSPIKDMASQRDTIGTALIQINESAQEL